MRSGPAVWAVIDQAIVSGATFITMIVIARLLDAENFSQFSLAFSACLFFAGIHRAFITYPLNALGATEPSDKLATRFSAALRLTLALGLIAAATLAFIARSYFPNVWLVLAASAYLIAFFGQELIRRLHYTTGSIETATRLDGVAYGVPLMLLAGGLLVHGSPASTFPFIAFTTGMVVASWLAYRGVPKHPRSGKLLDAASEHWSFSHWMVYSHVMFFLSSQLFPFFVSDALGAEAVASLNAANGVTNLFNLIRFTAGNYLPAQCAIKLNSGGVLELRKYLLKAGISALLVGFAFAMLIAFMSDWLVAFLYADKFEEAAKIMPSLAFVQLLTLVGVVSSVGAACLGRHREIFASHTIGAVLSLTIGIWLVRNFGLNGAIWGVALATGVPCLIQLILVWVGLKRFRNTGSHED